MQKPCVSFAWVKSATGEQQRLFMSQASVFGIKSCIMTCGGSVFHDVFFWGVWLVGTRPRMCAVGSIWGPLVAFDRGCSYFKVSISVWLYLIHALWLTGTIPFLWSNMLWASGKALLCIILFFDCVGIWGVQENIHKHEKIGPGQELWAKSGVQSFNHYF